jgi:hypothetical protein
MLCAANKKLIIKEGAHKRFVKPQYGQASPSKNAPKNPPILEFQLQKNTTAYAAHH